MPRDKDQPPIRCPECASQRIWKDGLRYTKNGEVQRRLCRDCGFRFSQTTAHRLVKLNIPGQTLESSNSGENFAKRSILNINIPRNKTSEDPSFSFSEDVGSHNNPLATIVGKELNSLCHYNRERRVCVSEGGTKNLVEVEPQLGEAGAGATPAEVKGKIVEFAWWLKKQGYKESTISKYSEVIQILVNRGANIFDPESVKEVIARQETCSINRKHLVTNVYTTFLRFLGRTWDPPRYRQVQKLPFIPTEGETNQLIAACSRRLGSFLQLLKETGMRPGEAWALKWFNIDGERQTVTVNDPEKGSNPRILNISSQLVARLELLPKHTEYVFRKTTNQILRNWTTNFLERRKTIARRLNNRRLLKISFKTFRHFKGTVLYHKTKDILYVKEKLGHKNVQNTLIYIHLEAAIFKTVNDEFTVRAAGTVEEAKQLLEVGFEYVTEIESVKLFRKRK